jgi:hypothetical protein
LGLSISALWPATAVEVGEAVVLLDEVPSVLVAHAEVEGEPGSQPEVVLEVEEVQIAVEQELGPAAREGLASK